MFVQSVVNKVWINGVCEFFVVHVYTIKPSSTKVKKGCDSLPIGQVVVNLIGDEIEKLREIFS